MCSSVLSAMTSLLEQAATLTLATVLESDDMGRERGGCGGSVLGTPSMGEGVKDGRLRAAIVAVSGALLRQG